jgi:hypothetical protein
VIMMVLLRLGTRRHLLRALGGILGRHGSVESSADGGKVRVGSLRGGDAVGGSLPGIDGLTHDEARTGAVGAAYLRESANGR